LRAHWREDAVSGFLVFLLALPLSLGIAKASDFPPLMGLVTAMVGGLLVSRFAGAPLTIKGPAAGLIVIVANAVADFGGGTDGWRLALGAIVVAGACQVLFGVFKLGRLSAVFPVSAIHGMMAAIGVIIIAKQVHVLLDVDPALTAGKGPFALLALIPHSLQRLDPKATAIGVASLAIMLGLPKVQHPRVRRIPAPLLVLALAIPAGLWMDFRHTEPAYALVHVGNLLDSLRWNVDFHGASQPALFARYVVMFALVGSLESLLTAKATDLIDPARRKSDHDRDLIAVGLGNMVAGALGGLPMISAVARSSANVANGGRTAWSGFFHGFFLLAFVLLATPVIELIPNAALAAMLITVGIRLAHPRQLAHTLHVGRAQLAIFTVTVVVTLVEDLLLGIAAGMATKFLINAALGIPLSAWVRAPTRVSFSGNRCLVQISEAATFSNLLYVKRKLKAIPAGLDVTIDLSSTRLVDHSSMEYLHQFAEDYRAEGGTIELVGLEEHAPSGTHQFAARRRLMAA
jgi:MFS superfamily sulfate permease-like transporter